MSGLGLSQLRLMMYIIALAARPELGRTVFHKVNGGPWSH